jgi:hypothetical protein
MVWSSEMMSLLEGLTHLHTLHLELDVRFPRGLQCVLQLTGLRELTLVNQLAGGQSLLQLTQLQQLISLDYRGSNHDETFQSKVWSAVLLLHSHWQHNCLGSVYALNIVQWHSGVIWCRSATLQGRTSHEVHMQKWRTYVGFLPPCKFRQ